MNNFDKSNLETIFEECGLDSLHPLFHGFSLHLKHKSSYKSSSFSSLYKLFYNLVKIKYLRKKSIATNKMPLSHYTSPSSSEFYSGKPRRERRQNSYINFDSSSPSSSNFLLNSSSPNIFSSPYSSPSSPSLDSNRVKSLFFSYPFSVSSKRKKSSDRIDEESVVLDNYFPDYSSSELLSPFELITSKSSVFNIEKSTSLLLSPSLKHFPLSPSMMNSNTSPTNQPLSLPQSQIITTLSPSTNIKRSLLIPKDYTPIFQNSRQKSDNSVLSPLFPPDSIQKIKFEQSVDDELNTDLDFSIKFSHQSIPSLGYFIREKTLSLSDSSNSLSSNTSTTNNTEINTSSAQYNSHFFASFHFPSSFYSLTAPSPPNVQFLFPPHPSFPLLQFFSSEILFVWLIEMKIKKRFCGRVELYLKENIDFNNLSTTSNLTNASKSDVSNETVEYEIFDNFNMLEELLVNSLNFKKGSKLSPQISRRIEKGYFYNSWKDVCSLIFIPRLISEKTQHYWFPLSFILFQHRRKIYFLLSFFNTCFELNLFPLMKEFSLVINSFIPFLLDAFLFSCSNSFLLLFLLLFLFCFIIIIINHYY
jgi:hypothetical protein